MDQTQEITGRRRHAKVVAVLTCFNRKAMTIACLSALDAAANRAHVELEAILVDDASTDGTGEAVRASFPWVEVIVSSGALYWNRGMHLGFGRARQRSADHYLWINDDTLLLPHALERLLRQAQDLLVELGRPVVLVGATAERDGGGRISYGGGVAKSRLKRFSYRKVFSENEPLPCDAMNGNCVLIPCEVAMQVGNLDPTFEHAMGDTDYALRAARAGFKVYVGAGIVGYCSNNPDTGTFTDESLPLRKRWQLMLSRKGLPVRSWLRFTRKHGGWLWPMYFASPYVKLLWSGIRRSRA